MILISVLFCLTLTAFVAGTVRHELQLIRIQTSVKRHPYARKWRNKPIVWIIGGVPNQRHNYRKIRRTNSLIARALLAAIIPKDAIIDRSAIKNAVQQFNDDPQLKLVEILPLMRTPHSIRELFLSYKLFAASPFVASRAGLGIDVTSGELPVAIRNESVPVSHMTFAYTLASWLAKLANLSILMYSLYLALVPGYALFFIIYIASFSAWLAWSIITYPHLRMSQKLAYLLLLPVSFVYFLFLVIVAPVRHAGIIWSMMHRRQNVMIDL